MITALSEPCATHELLPVPVDVDREDAALSLWILHELHHRGFDGVDDRWEWAPSLVPLRRRLEDDFEALLRDRHARDVTLTQDDDAVTALLTVIEGDAHGDHPAAR